MMVLYLFQGTVESLDRMLVMHRRKEVESGLILLTRKGWEKVLLMMMILTVDIWDTIS